MEQFSLEKYLENPQRKVVTGVGEKVRILCTDLKGYAEDVETVAAVTQHNGKEVIRIYDSNGVFPSIEPYHKDNLFFAPQKQSRWIFLYISHGYGMADCIQRSGLFESKEEAEEQMKILNGFALTEITWEE